MQVEKVWRAGMRVVVLIIVLTCVGAAHASSPGQPLDCSDWVLTEPGLSCAIWAPVGTVDQTSPFVTGGSNKQTDNMGGLLAIRATLVEFSSNPDISRYRFELVRRDGASEHVLGSIEERNYPSENIRDHFRFVEGSCASNQFCFLYGSINLDRPIQFDPMHGRLLLPVRTYCTKIDPFSGGGCPPDYPGGWQILAISGFTTTFEILQTYTPSASLGFRVPYMPEGLPAADHFDTYYGPLVKPIDFSQAQGLQCDYPSAPPTVGDYLEVADTVPTPGPGQGVYYFTAVSRQGQTRYGRKASGGVLSGRDPAGLAACSAP